MLNLDPKKGQAMGYDYDRLYQETPNALGAPSAVFVSFFKQMVTTPKRILDIGCGQGRDALFLGRLGHRVHGVDLSPHGIADLETQARKEGLSITGQVADLTQFTPDESYDIVLIDRTLHMLDTDPRHALLHRLLAHVRPAGWVLIEDEKSNLAGFRTVFAEDPGDWQVHTDKRGTLFLRRAE